MKPVIIIAIAFVLFIPTAVFAVDYRDSTGYIPSWAQGAGYHSVLMQCTEMVGDYSSDGNWCFEWTAYVLDQGVENFPQSTQGTTTSTSTHNVSERVCDENKLCAVTGDYLKYKNFDTFDDFEEIAIVEFKGKINENTIKFFSDGFGSKPLTYNLNLKTGMETHDEYTNVDRPFNFIEPIPMKIGQDVYRVFGNYYETKITAEMVSNLKEMGLMDIERTVVAAEINNGDDGTGGLVYDKETGVLLTQIEKYVLDGKEYTAGIVLIDTNIFSISTKIVPEKEIIISKNPKTESSSTIDYLQHQFQPIISDSELNIYQPTREQIVEKISPFFERNNGNPFWMTEPSVSDLSSIGTMQYSYKIHSVDEDVQIGSLFFNINDSDRSKIDITTYFIKNNPESIEFSSKIQQTLRETLFPNCQDCIETHAERVDSVNSFHGMIGEFQIEGVKIIINKGGYADSNESRFGQIIYFPKNSGGGCLIATATYGSELAPQVQQLRELRDNQLLSTESGTSFMNTFNGIYYSFSPVIADYERENPLFKEMVKVAITPMIASLSLMEYADSEESVLSIGISLIILNGLMYVGIPASVIVVMRRF